MVLVIIALGAYITINLSNGKQIEKQENNVEDGDVINNNNTNLIDFHQRVRSHSAWRNGPNGDHPNRHDCDDRPVPLGQESQKEEGKEGEGEGGEKRYREK